MTTLTTLPRITRFTGMYDGGPTDGGRDCVICPHCGAKGRYIYRFECEDGTSRGAMSGCVTLFPVSRIANTHKALIEKERKLRQSYGKDASLNRSDTKKMEVIESFYAGTMSESDALRAIDRETAAMAAWRSKKHGGRR